MIERSLSSDGTRLSHPGEANVSPDQAEAVLQRAAETAKENADRHARTAATVALPAARILVECRGAAQAEADIHDLAEQRAHEAKVEKLLERCGIPARYSEADLNDLTSVPEDVRGRYADVAGRLLQLMGNPCILALLGKRGPGKTWMGCGLVREFCQAGRPARYLDVMDYFVEVKQTYSDRARRDESQVETDYVRPHLLVIDELHERGDTPWEDRMLTRLINKRYAANVATVLISNDDIRTFMSRVGDSIKDRILDGGGFIPCDWQSLRGRIKG